MFGIDACGGTVDLANPIGELVAVGDGGGEAHELDFGGTVDDGFFPDGSALAIVHVVTFIEDDGLYALDGGSDFADAGSVEHVTEDLGGHDDDGGIAVEGEVAGEESDVGMTKLLLEVSKFLVGEGFEGGGVEDALLVGEGAVDGIFADEGFAGPGGGADDRGLAGVEGGDRLVLKVVEGKGKKLV